MSAFYLPLADGRYRATEHTVGPWSPAHQHAGPPSALLAHEVARNHPSDSARVARVTVEILGPVPVGELTVTTEVLRGGRNVELLGATLAADDRVALRASFWRVRTAPTGLTADAAPALGPLTEAAPHDPPHSWGAGYLHAMEWRWHEGFFDVPGPARLWARMRHPLVAGRAVAPLERVLTLADSGNGVSSRLDPREWLFVNTELSVHVVRAARGEWIGMAARTTLSDDGVGLAATTLYDEHGELGRGAQALFVARRD